MINNTPKIMIVGTGSGCGKTTVTIALLKALKMNNIDVSAFKCGPDYIDPSFHKKVIDTPSYNLDLFMCDEDTVKYLFYKNTKLSSIAVVEGVMGMYDGLGFKDDSYSSNHLSRVLNIPQILVCDVKGKSLSLLAEIKGYLTFGKNNLVGVILNNCSSVMYSYYKEMIEDNLEISVCGYLEKSTEVALKSRHLGLVTADEVQNIKEKVTILGNLANKSIDIEKILELAKASTHIILKNMDIENNIKSFKENNNINITIAVARDVAFCFYYEDCLRLLEELGAKLIYFSPLVDNTIPQEADGLILGGGYPEEYLQKLSSNKSMLQSIKAFNNKKLPIYAECGGFMYLGKAITKDNVRYNMADIVDSEFVMSNKLVRFGYGTLTAKGDNMLCDKGDIIKCHEFHYSDTDNYGDDFTIKKSRGKEYDSIIAGDNLFAGYPHLHFYSNLEFVKNFILRCKQKKRYNND